MLFRSVHLQYGDHTNVVNKVSEEELTNGIIKVTRAEKKTVYFLEGHGEPSVNEMEEPKGYGQIKTALDNESYEVKTLVLAEGAAVPDDANLLIVAGAEPGALKFWSTPTTTGVETTCPVAGFICTAVIEPRRT